jgi:diphthine synthase
VRSDDPDPPQEEESVTPGLSLISIGLSDEKDISLRALDEARSCDVIYTEMYTTKLDTDAGRLSALIGKPVEKLTRKRLEDESDELLDEAQRLRVGVLIGGDCLTATTHISLLLDAKKRSIPTQVVHGSSILTAVAETGLSLYKFGRTVTLPLPERGRADVVLDAVAENLEHGLHTLILLDFDEEAGLYLTINKAVAMLIDADRPDAFNRGTLTVGVARLGWGNPVIRAGRAEEVAEADFGSPPYALIIPSRLHFLEAEALKAIAGCPATALEGRRVRGELERLVERYMESCRGALDGLRPGRLPKEVGEREVKDLIEHAERYLRDSRYYAAERRPTALASVCYSEGILDALRLLGLVEFEW